MSETKELIEVVSDNAKPIPERSDALRKLMLANAPKISLGADKLFNAERAIQVACLSMRKNPKLLNCTIPSLFGAISEASTYGWTCDGVLGHAYLVPFNNTKEIDGRRQTVTEATLIPGYKGLRDLVRRSGECETVMESVHEGDEFQFRGPFSEPHHVRSDNPQRKFSPLTHAYLLAYFPKTLTTKCFVMSKAECLAHRDRYSQNYRSAKKYKRETESAWHEDHPEFRVMCMKTVLLEAIHRGELPMSVAGKQMAERELEVAETEVSTIDGVVEGVIEHTQEEPPQEDDPQGTDSDFELQQMIDNAISSIEAMTDSELLERFCKTAIASVREQGGDPSVIEQASKVKMAELKPKGKAKQKELA